MSCDAPNNFEAKSGRIEAGDSEGLAQKLGTTVGKLQEKLDRISADYKKDPDSLKRMAEYLSKKCDIDQLAGELGIVSLNQRRAEARERMATEAPSAAPSAPSVPLKQAKNHWGGFLGNAVKALREQG